MPDKAEILQVLLLKDESVSRELDRALWAAFQEVEAFYNSDQPRALFSRLYLSETSPVSRLESFFGRWKDLKWLPVAGELWKHAAGKYSKTFDQQKLAELVDLQMGGNAPTGFRLIVTDREITPPKGFRYIIWDSVDNASVVSIPPTDPLYWRENDQGRLTIIKHRVRTALLSVVGEFLGLHRCENERCFLFSDVDSVLRLDEMVYLGQEHNLTNLAGRGFTPHVTDPERVQTVVEFSTTEGAVL